MNLPSDVRLAFNEAAEIYDQARPSYPPDLFDSLFALLPHSPRIVEIGPGTGQATKDLLIRGAIVHAVEIGPAMAAKLQANYGPDRLQVSVGDFETLHIEPGSGEAVFSATAYHWISPCAQLDQPEMILRRHGVISIVDLIQVDSPDDRGFFAAAQPIYERYGQGHRGPPAPCREQVRPPIFDALATDPRYEAVSVRHYDWNQSYTAAEYRRLMLSYSVTQMMETTKRAGLLDDIEDFIRTDYADIITRPLVVTLTTAILA